MADERPENLILDHYPPSIVFRLCESVEPLAYLSRLSLTNFRNLAQLELELPAGVVVFFGANAQGKTTLLEAVYLLAIARSFRAENEREVVNFQAAAQGEPALVGGTVEKKGERLSIYVGYQSAPGQPPQSPPSQGGGKTSPLPPDRGYRNPPLPKGDLGGFNSLRKESSGTRGSGSPAYSIRKQIRVSRVRRTAAELVGMMGAVLFSADDIELVYGSPAQRRRYLDILISQSDHSYIKALQRYQRVVQQRNQLLRLLREGRAGEAELDFWDRELVREGAWITWQRQEAIRVLSRLCAQHHQDLSGSEAEFYVEYRPTVPQGDSLQDTEDRFLESLAAFRQRELATVTTVVGPHRDDFKLLMSGLDMGTFASRGEARTLALTLRLAEAAYLALARNDEPVVLLDDVLSEMDASRRLRVLEKITRYQQALITTTDLELVQGFFGPAATYFRVGEGQVIPLASEVPTQGAGTSLAEEDME
jgi:DNA replication and repair protein RecF